MQLDSPQSIEKKSAKDLLGEYIELLTTSRTRLEELAVTYKSLDGAKGLQVQHFEESIRESLNKISEEFEEKHQEALAAYQAEQSKAKKDAQKQRDKIEADSKDERRALRAASKESNDHETELAQKREQTLAEATRKLANFNQRAEESEKNLQDLIQKLPPLNDDQEPKSLKLNGTSHFNKLADLDKQLAELNEQIGPLISAKTRFKASKFVSIMLQVVVLLIVGGIGYVAWKFVKLPNPNIIPIITGITWLSFAIWLIAVRAGVKRKRYKQLGDDARFAAGLQECFNRLVNRARADLDPEKALTETIDKLLEKQKKEEEKLEIKRRQSEKKLTQVKSAVKRKLEDVDAKLSLTLQDIEDAHKQQLETLKTEQQTAEKECTQGSGSEQQAIVRENEQQQQDTEKERDDILLKLKDRSKAIVNTMRSDYRSWQGSYWDTWQPPTQASHNIPLGMLHKNLNALLKDCGWDQELDYDDDISIPIDLLLPETALLHSRMNAEAGMQAIHQAMLRILTSFPPGQARFTIFDPRGLGDHFSLFLRLVDYDEHLVGAKVWTTQSDIEQSLATLAEHAEKVIQKFLRNQYKTLDEYNEAAGDLAEPYHILVIAEFPHGFSPLAIERLSALLEYGPRCGILVWMQHDPANKIPKELNSKIFRQTGVVLDRFDDKIGPAQDAFRDFAYEAEIMPAPRQIERILNTIGEQTATAINRALPMEAGVPKQKDLWSSDSGEILRIPIGRSGAERLQYLELGEGTAQHVLIGGRTGSGKSTLLHILISNGALWYGPDQLQFYLVDFKKGVEFKTYASNNFPHARVIAVESDREYALSVLHTIDEELERRGAMFRKAEVQDLASYRAARPDEFVPRSLLVIDEFHEFFTEDDGIARDAALLLERFVRQGRAFGLHIILGSQSIAGSMSLARSAVGQIGVRIALQCNEADSQLILSEENTAARLLERPGEAIYNGRSGQVEGNNPFQVFWLTEDDQTNYLKSLAEKPVDNLPPTWVFEGNVPAQIINNQPLVKLLGQERSDAEKKMSCWLGEPNAIKGPTELQFASRPGSNLLMVGHNRDAVYGMIQSSLLSFAARYNPGDIRLVVVDGDDADPRLHKRLHDFATALPHKVEWLEAAAGVEVISELGSQVTDGGKVDGPATMIYVLGLGRLRPLRQEDDFSFGMSDDKPNPGKLFGELLTNGPEQSIHSFVWCESATVVNTALQRATLRNFEKRLLFQMSSGDSSELIDDGGASRLGLHHALLCDLESLHREKFRPCVLTDLEEGQDLIKLVQG